MGVLIVGVHRIENNRPICINVHDILIRCSPKTDSYHQFDSPMTINQKEDFWNSIYSSPDIVTKHQFLPMVLREKSFLKFHMVKKNDVKKVVIKPKVRPIVEVAHRDAAIYKLYSTLLSEKYEKKIADAPIYSAATAYRPINKTNIESSHEVMDMVVGLGDAWIIKGDFKGFFDTLNYRILKKQLMQVIGQGNELPSDWYAVYKSLTQYRTIAASNITDKMNDYAKLSGKYVHEIRDLDKLITEKKIKVSNKSSRGIPQGTSMSAVMANVYMLEFDKKVCDFISPFGGKYRRYSDDFVVLLPGTLTEEDTLKIKSTIIELSKTLVKLTIEKSKTKLLKYDSNNRQIFLIENNEYRKSAFDYLGFSFDGKRICIRTKSLLKFTRKYHRAVHKSTFLYKRVLREGSQDLINKSELHLNTIKLTQARLNLNQYYLVDGYPMTFYGYAIRSAKEFEKSSDLYDVVIRRQANTLQRTARKYENQSRKLSE